MAASTGIYCAAHSIFSVLELMNILIRREFITIKQPSRNPDYPMIKDGRGHKNSVGPIGWEM